jgi:hypothetical protein
MKLTKKDLMNKLFVGLMAILWILPSSLSAYERGETAYVCSKNQKFMWVVGQDSWTACPVRILQKAGQSYKVLAHQKSCLLSGSSMINKGREKWLESYQLWATRRSCEAQGVKTKPQDTSIKITNKCSEDLNGFVYYKDFSGNWVKGKNFLIPNNGKVYNAWGAKTRNRVIDFHITGSKGGSYGSGDGTTVHHDGKDLRLSRFKSNQIPVHMIFCK